MWIDRAGVRRLTERGAQIVEVLERRQYEWAHLPGAIHIFLPKLDAEAPRRLDRTRPVVVYCHDHL